MSEHLKNKLWSVVENSNVYSFKDEPLYVFGIFTIYTMSMHKYGESLDQIEWVDFLLESTEKVYKKESELKYPDVYWGFVDILNTTVNENRELLSDIIDFFAEKYLLIHSESIPMPIMKKQLSDFMYWYALGDNCDTLDTPIYNPFAGFATFGKEHAKGLNLQLGYDLENIDKGTYYDLIKDSSEIDKLQKATEIRKDYKECAWYYGVESDHILRHIAMLRMFVNNPLNFNQMYICEGDSLSNEIDTFNGTWTYIATPPCKSYVKINEEDVNLISKLIHRFMYTEAMEYAYLLLPKCFCYANIFKDIRSEIIAKKLLKCVIEIPQKMLENNYECVIVYLSKSTYSCGTKVIDANKFIEKDILQFRDLIWFSTDDTNSPKGKFIGDYTFSQCNYCILPSMYLQSESCQYDNEDLRNSYSKYVTFIESIAESEKKRIAHRNVSGQLSHMLGATYHKIFDAISELKHIEGLEDTYSMLYDNFDYMKRLINSIDDDFSTQKMNFEEVPVNEFIQKYCCAWKNYGKKFFSVDFTSEISNNTTFKIDDVFMKVLLDAVLGNANRHGFNGIEVENPQILISTSYTIVNKMSCVLISIANNGAPFPEGFTIEQYVREGEFGGTNGNTGRGGFHTYQITKRHQGYISINSDDKWNVKINIMIPIEYYDECETEKFLEYGEEKYM